MSAVQTRLLIVVLLVSFVLASPSSRAHAAALGGPVIVGGDDLTEHGSFSGTNLQGWHYIEQAVADIADNVATCGAPDDYTVDIAALGSFECMPPTPCFGGGNAGAAIGSAAAALGFTVEYYGDAAAIETFFDLLADGTTKPRMIWLAGGNVANSLVDPSPTAEGQVLLENADVLNAFVAAGHGLVAHGAAFPALAWLPTLLPDVIINPGCEALGAHLTAAGQAAFPSLVNSDIDDSAGPCHNTFQITEPDGLRGLRVLAVDGLGAPPAFAVCVGSTNEGSDCANNADCSGGGTCETGAATFIMGGQCILPTGCGNDLVDQTGEECDGSDDAACLGKPCFPAGHALECRCSLCETPEGPGVCKTPVAKKAKISITDKPGKKKDQLKWKWKGGNSTKAEFGAPNVHSNPTAYQLCVYYDGELQGVYAPRVGDLKCPTAKNAGKACWKEKTTGFGYKDKSRIFTGVDKVKLKAASPAKTNGTTQVKLRGRRFKVTPVPLDVVADPDQDLPVLVQLKNKNKCWEATYSSFKKNEVTGGGTAKFKATSE